MGYSKCDPAVQARTAAKAPMIFKEAGNLRAIQILLGHANPPGRRNELPIVASDGTSSSSRLSMSLQTWMVTMRKKLYRPSLLACVMALAAPGLATVTPVPLTPQVPAAAEGPV